MSTVLQLFFTHIINQPTAFNRRGERKKKESSNRAHNYRNGRHSELVYLKEEISFKPVIANLPGAKAHSSVKELTALKRIAALLGSIGV